MTLIQELTWIAWRPFLTNLAIGTVLVTVFYVIPACVFVLRLFEREKANERY